jgi:hypothetical protein
VLNASGANLLPAATSSFTVNPVRAGPIASLGILEYNTSGEITYNNGNTVSSLNKTVTGTAPITATVSGNNTAVGITISGTPGLNKMVVGNGSGGLSYSDLIPPGGVSSFFDFRYLSSKSDSYILPYSVFNTNTFLYGYFLFESTIDRSSYGFFFNYTCKIVNANNVIVFYKIGRETSYYDIGFNVPFFVYLTEETGSLKFTMEFWYENPGDFLIFNFNRVLIYSTN